MSDRILIPEKLYVGIQRRNAGARPLAALTAWGTDASAKSRINTVDSYAQNAVTITNEPLRGFKLHDRHVWKDELWLEDPRGFSVSVKANHMLNMLNTCTVVKGEIQEPLIWARCSGNNVILNVHSHVYERARLQTEVANSKLSWKEAKLGNQITLASGIKGQYLGKAYSLKYYFSGWVTDTGPLEVSTTAKIQLVQSPQSWNTVTRTINRELHMLGTATLARVDDATELTAAQAELDLNDHLQDNACYVGNTYSSKTIMSAFNKFDVSDCELRLVPLDLHYQDYYTLPHKAFVISPSGELAHVSAVNKQHDATLYVYDQAAFNQGMLKYKVSPPSHRAHHREVLKETMKLNALTKFMALEISLKTKLGNTITARY